MKTYIITLVSMAVAVVLFVSCSGTKTGRQAEKGSNISEKTVVSVVESLKGEAFDEALMERGVRACAALWREEDGSEAEFTAWVKENYARTAEEKQKLFEHLSYSFECLNGCQNDVIIRLQRPVVLAGRGEPSATDYTLSGFNPFSHLGEDLFKNKIAFVTALNFPFYTLEEKNTLGPDWDALQWGYARMGDMYTDRIPSDVLQQYTSAAADAENYISDYNIMMGHLLTEEGERLFPEDMVLLSHWNLRDELKADYDNPAKQEMIFEVMQRIVLQEIPECVINNADYDWKPYSNEVFEAGSDRKVEAAREADRRYARILDVFHANLAMDKYCPQMPTGIIRNFEGSVEVSADEIESLFVRLLGSEEVKKVGALIKERLGRDLRPYDIWYDGFKSRSSLNEDDLTAKTRALYPDAAAFKKAMPAMLVKLGFEKEDAEYICDKILVEPARGSGHAWETMSRWQPALLRTRIGNAGMDYKGYNIAVHEFGHNVEQTLDMYCAPNYMMSGIPNTGLTEAMAFIFQKRDLQLLLGTPAQMDDNTTLDIFWGAYEIMGVALVDMYTWRWLYDNPSATPEQLREAVVRLAREVWNLYFEPVLGTHDCPLLAVYSHMVDAPMYLPNYPYGHLAEYQLEEHLAQFKTPAEFAAELRRIYVQGRLTPNVWMTRATGAAVSVEPLLRATSKIVNVK